MKTANEENYTTSSEENKVLLRWGACTRELGGMTRGERWDRRAWCLVCASSTTQQRWMDEIKKQPTRNKQEIPLLASMFIFKLGADSSKGTLFLSG